MDSPAAPRQHRRPKAPPAPSLPKGNEPKKRGRTKLADPPPRAANLENPAPDTTADLRALLISAALLVLQLLTAE